MIGSVLVSREGAGEGMPRRVVVRWVADDAGDVRLLLGAGIGTEPLPAAKLRLICTSPSLASPPTDGYNVALYDRQGVNVLGAVAEGRSDTETEIACPFIAIGDDHVQAVLLDGGDYELVITGAGDHGAGELYLESA